MTGYRVQDTGAANGLAYVIRPNGTYAGFIFRRNLGRETHPTDWTAVAHDRPEWFQHCRSRDRAVDYIVNPEEFPCVGSEDLIHF